jgi:peptide/nickel transport system permease protein
MRHGEIIETGTTKAVLSKPKHAYTKRLIACVPKLGQGKAFLSDLRGLFASDAAGRS